MSRPGEHKTVQARILKYVQEVGCRFVSRDKAEERRGKSDDSAKSPPSLFFDDLLDPKLRDFNPRYAEADGAPLGQFDHLHTDIYGNWEFIEHLRNRGKFFDHEEKYARDLIQNLLRPLLHEPMTTKTRVHELELPTVGYAA